MKTRKEKSNPRDDIRSHELSGIILEPNIPERSDISNVLAEEQLIRPTYQNDLRPNSPLPHHDSTEPYESLKVYELKDDQIMIEDDDYSDESEDDENIHIYDDQGQVKSVIDEWVAKKVWVRIDSDRSKYNGCIAQVKFRQGRGRQNQMKVHAYVDDGNGGFYVQEAGVSVGSCQLATDEDSRAVMEWLGMNGLTSRIAPFESSERHHVIDDWVAMKAWIKIESDKSKYRNCIGQVRFRQGKGRQNQMKAQVYIEGSGGYSLQEVGVSVCNCRLATDEETRPLFSWLIENVPKQAVMAGLLEREPRTKPNPTKRTKRKASDDVAEEISRLAQRPFKDAVHKDDMDKLSIMAEWITNKAWIKIISSNHKYNGCVAIVKTDKSGSKFQLVVDVFEYIESEDSFRRQEASVAISSCAVASEKEIEAAQKWLEECGENKSKASIIEEWVNKKIWIQVTSERSKLNGMIGQIRHHHGPARKHCMRGHFYIEDGNGGYLLQQSTDNLLELPQHLRKYAHTIQPLTANNEGRRGAIRIPPSNTNESESSVEVSPQDVNDDQVLFSEGKANSSSEFYRDENAIDYSIIGQWKGLARYASSH